jgi:hypothetical protein
MQAWINGTSHCINGKGQIEKLRYTCRCLCRIGNGFLIIHVQNRDVLLRCQPALYVVEMLRKDRPECLIIGLVTLFTPPL